jgi:hypothetical protein
VVEASNIRVDPVGPQRLVVKLTGSWKVAVSLPTVLTVLSVVPTLAEKFVTVAATTCAAADPRHSQSPAVRS